MFSVESLREFINERLDAAAAEIFTEFEKRLVQHGEEHRLLVVTWEPQNNTDKTVPQQHVCKEEEVLADIHLRSDEKTSSLDQIKPEPPHFEELFNSREEEQHELNQDRKTSQNTSSCEIKMEVIPQDVNQDREEIHQLHRKLDINWNPQIRLHRIDLPQQQEVLSDQQFWNHERNSSLDQNQPEQETDTFMLTPTDQEKNLEAEPNTEQLYSLNFPLTESSSQQQSKNPDLVPTTNVKMNEFKRKKCGKAFTDKGILQKCRGIHKRHLRCETCGKDFRYNSHFNNHLRTHTGEKPHSCGTCGKSFSHRSSLSKHMKIHTGEKPHVCGTCGKSFIQKSKLNKHLNVHIEKVDS